jgi:hypothetical protein
VGGIFISHASADDDFVAELRQRLEERRLAVWVDSRQLRGGARLAPEIEAAIADAPHVLVVLSPATVNSPWLAREVRTALRGQSERGDGYRVIPLLLPGMTVGALQMWFPDEEPVAVVIGPDGLAAAMPELLAALGERLPTDREEFTTPEAGAVEELILRLSSPRMVTQDGIRRAWAIAQLVHEPARPERRAVDSRAVRFHRAAGADRGRRPALVSGELLALAGRGVPRPRVRDRGPAAGVGGGTAHGRPGRRARVRGVGAGGPRRRGAAILGAGRRLTTARSLPRW